MDAELPDIPPPVHPTSNPKLKMERHRPKFIPADGIPVLFDMEKHISHRIKSGKTIPALVTCGSSRNTTSWYWTISPDVRRRIETAEFRDFVGGLNDCYCDRSVV